MWSPENELKTEVVRQPFINGLSGPVTIPLLQSVITALMAGLFAVCLVVVFSIKVNGWGVFGLVSTGTMLLTWLSFRGHWMQIIEAYLGIDLDGNGVVGDPQPVPDPQPLRVDLVRENGEDWLRLPYRERLPALAASVLPTRQFSQTAYVGTGKLFSRGEYDALISKLISSGLACWKNENHHNAGVQLTSAGAAVFRRLVPSPALPEDTE